LFKAMLTILIDYLKIRITTDYEEQTRARLFEKVLNSSWTHLMRQKLGVLETILAIDVPTSAKFLEQIAGGIMVITGLLIYVFFAFNISAPITLMTLGLGTLLFFVFRPFLKRINTLAIERNRHMKESAHHVSENIFGVKTVKTMYVAAEVASKGRGIFRKLRFSTLQVPFLKSITNAVTEPIAVIFVSLIFATTYQRPDFNLAVLIAIVYLVQRMFVYSQQVQRIAHAVSDFSPHVQSVLHYETKANTNPEIDSGRGGFEFARELRFDDVSFAHDGSAYVLSNVDLVIQRGSLIGLIGPSGAGKTTLVDLLLRLFEPTSGAILLDGRNISEISLAEWRKKIGYVSQDIFLINDTIENNIRFYNKNISKTEIEKAALMANIHDFVLSLPQGYDTVIGERGVRLSGGERQRVVLARVLARKPEILILDEATSSLDNESEAQIQKVIKNLKGRITVLAIAHRLSTVMDSDKLLVLENGKLVEQGEPKALLADKNSYFFRTYNIIQNN